MDQKKEFKIRCRAIILHEGRLLVVKHVGNATGYALPGGHLEFGEGIEECMRREIFEELGIKPVLGKLLYINTFIENTAGKHSVEFFFEVKNSEDFADISKFQGSHSHELENILWAEKGDGLNVLPAQVRSDLDSGEILSRDALFIIGTRD